MKSTHLRTDPKNFLNREAGRGSCGGRLGVPATTLPRPTSRRTPAHRLPARVTLHEHFYFFYFFIFILIMLISHTLTLNMHSKHSYTEINLPLTREVKQRGAWIPFGWVTACYAAPRLAAAHRHPSLNIFFSFHPIMFIT